MSLRLISLSQLMTGREMDHLWEWMPVVVQPTRAIRESWSISKAGSTKRFARRHGHAVDVTTQFPDNISAASISMAVAAVGGLSNVKLSR